VTQLWLALLTALAGFLGGVVVTRLNSRWTHLQWQRAKLAESCQEYYALLTEARQSFMMPPAGGLRTETAISEFERIRRQLIDSGAKLAIFGSGKLSGLASEGSFAYEKAWIARAENPTELSTWQAAATEFVILEAKVQVRMRRDLAIKGQRRIRPDRIEVSFDPAEIDESQQSRAKVDMSQQSRTQLS
jgi:hypothetical protein